MDLEAARRSLPSNYLIALQHALGGGNEADVAAAVGVPIEAVPSLLRLATSKLASVLGEP